MARVTPRILSGFVEFLPEDQIQFNKMFDTIRGVYERYGYAPIETPAIELSEILLAKAGGETEKQIYHIAHADKDMALHFDLTVPLARYVAQHEGQLVFPFRRYQMQKVWRGERSQAGRYREFYQCDIDVVGSANVLYDAEMPAVISAVFRKLDIGSFTIKLNNRKVLQGFMESLLAGASSVEVMRIIDKLDKIGEPAARSELAKLGLADGKIDKLFDFLSIDGKPAVVIDKLKAIDTNSNLYAKGLAELEAVLAGMHQLGVPEGDYVVDVRIARGLDYYTGTVYETTLDDFPGIGSICSGGRYDNLASNYTKSKLPGVGVSIGLTRLFPQLKEVGLIKPEGRTLAGAVVVALSDQAMDRALAVAAELRSKGVSTLVNFDSSQPSKLMRYVDRLGAPYAVMIGDDELESGLVTLKDMQTGEQLQVSTDKAAKIMTK